MPDSEHAAGPATPPGYLGTLGKGLRVLLVLQSGPASVSGLARELGMDRTGTFRVLRTLEHHGFVRRDEFGEYRLGVRLWELGTQVFGDGDVVAHSGEFADELLRATQETVHVAVYDEGWVVYVVKRDGTAAISSYTRLGGRAPAHCVATGKALLAYCEPGEVDRLVAAGLRRFTEHTVADGAALRRELDEIRRCGFALNRGEWRAEVGGVAAPILDREGRPVAAIGVSGPLERVSERAEKYAELVRWAAGEISKRLRGLRT